MALPAPKHGLALAVLLCALPGLAGQGTPPAAKPAPPAQAPAPSPRRGLRKLPRKDQVDLNNAPKARLKELPGISDALADKIIAGRPYVSKMRVVTAGVLPNELFQSIRDRLYVGAPQTAKN